MLWLTGLVGAMLAGSVAILGTIPFGPDEAEDDAETGQDDIATTFDVVTAMPESDPSGASVDEAAAVRSTSTSGPDIAATPDAEAEPPGEDPGRVWTTLSPDGGALEVGTDADESFAGTGRTDVIDGAARFSAMAASYLDQDDREQAKHCLKQASQQVIASIEAWQETSH